MVGIFDMAFHVSKLVNDGVVLKKSSQITSVFCTFESVNAFVMILQAKINVFLIY